MSRIAAQLGGSKDTLYSYFSSKDALFRAVMLRACKQIEAAPPIVEPGGGARDQLVLCARTALTSLTSPQMIALQRLVIGEGGRFPDLSRAFYASGPKAIIRFTADILGALIAKGRLDQTDPVQAAHLFHDLAVAGPVQLCLLGEIEAPAPDQIAACVESAVDVFLRTYSRVPELESGAS